MSVVNRRISIVGSGNVATHITVALSTKGYEIAGVFSRSIDNARALTRRCGLPDNKASDDFGSLPSAGADTVIVSLADGCVREVLSKIPRLENTVVLHTSGTLPMEVLSCLTSSYGIIYPLQTFSKNVDVDMSTVPFFTEGADVPTLAVADSIASSLSDTVAHADARKRHALHIAGVLSCNFPNYLWECVEKILAAEGYDLHVVEPLVRATVDKAFSVGPHAAQTGPAHRGDRAVIADHRASLPADLSDVYASLSEMIMKSHGK